MVNERSGIEPIVWKPYEGEEIIVNTIIRNGKRTYEKQFFEDKVKAVPRGNAYCIGNGPSRKGLNLGSGSDLGVGLTDPPLSPGVVAGTFEFESAAYTGYVTNEYKE